MTSIYLSGPAIARLTLGSRMSANRHLRAGKFGPLVRRGPVAYAPLAAVEHQVGRQFTPEQIAMAVDGRPDRLITIDVED
jgi:hypothetical protein